MIYVYMLENTRADVFIDNSPVFKLLPVYHINDNDIFSDPIDSLQRPSLVELKDKLKYGDTIILRSIADLSNNLKDFLKALDYLYSHGIEIISTSECYYRYQLYYLPLKDFMDIDMNWKKIKRVVGIEKAKMEGRMGRKTDTEKAKKIEDALKLYYTGQFQIKDIIRICSVPSSSFYRALNKSCNGNKKNRKQ